MVATRRLEQLTSSVLHDLVLPEGSLVVALSGGADSSGLAYVTCQSGRRVRAVHVDHGLPGSPVMREAAVAVADNLDLDLDVVEVELSRGPSPEGVARAARYRAFSDLVADDESLMTAHTRDDNAETVLMNVVRGSGLRGMAGIPSFRSPNIYRPALGVGRPELRELALLSSLPFVDDPMNADLDLTRAFVRANLMPLLAEMNPKVVDALSGAAESARTDLVYLDQLAEDVPMSFENGMARVSVGDLAHRSPSMVDRTIRRMVNSVSGDDAYSRARSEAVDGVLAGRVASAELGRGITAWRDGPSLVVGFDSDLVIETDVVLSPGVSRHGGRTFTVVASSGPATVIPLSRWAAIFPSEVELVATADGWVTADGERAWLPGERRRPVAWYQPGTVGYLSVYAAEGTEWT